MACYTGVILAALGARLFTSLHHLLACVVEFCCHFRGAYYCCFLFLSLKNCFRAQAGMLERKKNPALVGRMYERTRGQNGAWNGIQGIKLFEIKERGGWKMASSPLDNYSSIFRHVASGVVQCNTLSVIILLSCFSESKGDGLSLVRYGTVRTHNDEFFRRGRYLAWHIQHTTGRFTTLAY